MGPPEYQGVWGNARNPSQRVKQRPALKGADAIRELERLFAPAETFTVIAIRADGREVVYKHAESRADADATVAALARIGLRAEVRVGIDRLTRPGTSIRQAR